MEMRQHALADHQRSYSEFVDCIKQLRLHVAALQRAMKLEVGGREADGALVHTARKLDAAFRP